MKSGDLKLIKKEKVKSALWKHIGIVKGEKKLPFVACKKCFKCFKYGHSTGTTHLARHVDQCANIKAFKSEVNSIANYCKRKISAAAKTEVLNSVVNLVVQDLRPVSVVDGRGMQTFSQKLINAGAKYGCLDAKELLSSRNTVSKHMKL